jgi:threonine dehydrogenase-like Zn-dependent dehydrogenase
MSVPRTTVASVMTARRKMEVRELPIPDLEPDAGLLRVEAAGVCGADVGFFNRDLSPRVLGHENVGTIAAIGASAAHRWGVSEGDRVVLEEYLPCGHCEFCRSSDFRLCMASDASANPDALRYGSTPLTRSPGLWGGYSQYLYLHPNTVPHRLPSAAPVLEASLSLPLANGFEWAHMAGGAGPGSSLVVMGPGQQGLGSALAAKVAGAELVIVTGLRRDAHRLDVARKLGADVTVCVEDEDLRDRVAELTGGRGVDAVIDTAAGDERTLADALEIVRKGGRLVLPAAPRRPLEIIDFYKVTRKFLTVRGMRGHSYAAVEWAIATIASGRHPLRLLCSLQVGLEETDRAILGTAGETEDAVIHAAVLP